jgi:hypothetical protein
MSTINVNSAASSGAMQSGVTPQVVVQPTRSDAEVVSQVAICTVHGS